MFQIANKILFLIIFISALIFPQDNNIKRFVAVTFDDLPMNTKYLKDGNQWIEQTKKLISSIKKYNIPAIGFVNAYKLYVNEKLDSTRFKVLQLWSDAELELGNHTYSHPDFNNTNTEDYFDNILQGEKIIKELLAASNKKLEYFRHPLLHTGDTQEKKNALEEFLKEHSYIVAPVTIDNSEFIFARAYENAFNNKNAEVMKKIGDEYIGYMIKVLEYFINRSEMLFGYNIKQTLLLHANMLNADYFDELVEVMVNKNYTFISLEETLKDPAYNSEDSYIGKKGISWIQRWAISKNVDKSFFADEPEVPRYILDISGL